VVDHVHQHRAGAHGAAFARDKGEFQELVQGGLGLPGAPVAVPAIDVFLRLAQFAQIGMQQVV